MEYVEIVPTWRAAVQAYMQVLEFGDNEKTKQDARAELLRLADIADGIAEGRE